MKIKFRSLTIVTILVFFSAIIAVFGNGCSVVEKINFVEKKPARTISSLPTNVTGRAQFANWKNHKVRYEEFGHGSEEAIVFIHGWACDSSFWSFQINEFAARQRVITIDLPGHGKSDHPSFLKYNVDEFTDAVNAVFETTGIRKAVLVGHSLGGLVVRQFYRNFPQKVTALIIADSELNPWSKESVDVVKQKVSELKNGKYKKVASDMIDSMFVPSTPEFLRNEIKRKMTSTTKPVMTKALAGLIEAKLYKTDTVKVPTLVIRAKSPYVTADTEKGLRSFIPDLNYQEWENVGHFVMMEDPDKFNQAVLKFLLNKRL